MTKDRSKAPPPPPPPPTRNVRGSKTIPGDRVLPKVPVPPRPTKPKK